MGHTQAHPSQLEASPPTKMLRRLASSILQSQRSFSSAPLYNSVTEALDRIKHVASPAVVKEVGAVFHFKVSDQSYVVDLKNGAGSVTTGAPTAEPDVAVQMDTAHLLNREIEPMNALSTGVITMQGDLTKALTLEKVMVLPERLGSERLMCCM